MPTRDHLVTSGTFFPDGGTWDVDNNIWIRDRLLVLDPGPGFHSGHRLDTTIAAQAPDLPEWIARTLTGNPEGRPSDVIGMSSPLSAC
jgi:hypothetical protein